jgi:outer membrane protein assembly factor BamD
MGCAGTINDDDNYDFQFKEALRLLEKEKFISAQDILNRLAIRASHTEIGDKIQFHLGESYFLNEEYQLAIIEYNKLVRRMGFSPLVEQARWRICKCYVAMSPKYYLDQISSEKAIEKLQEFIEDYPISEQKDSANQTVLTMRNKLGEKAYETGILYIKLGAYDSAILAFEQMIENYYDTEFVLQAHLGIIRSYSALEEVDKVEKYFQSNKHIFPEDTVKEANKIIIDLKKRVLEKG